MLVQRLASVSRVSSEEGMELCTDDYKLLQPCVADTDDQDQADDDNSLHEIADTCLPAERETRLIAAALQWDREFWARLLPCGALITLIPPIYILNNKQLRLKVKADSSN